MHFFQLKQSINARFEPLIRIHGLSTLQINIQVSQTMFFPKLSTSFTILGPIPAAAQCWLTLKELILDTWKWISVITHNSSLTPWTLYHLSIVILCNAQVSNLKGLAVWFTIFCVTGLTSRRRIEQQSDFENSRSIIRTSGLYTNLSSLDWILPLLTSNYILCEDWTFELDFINWQSASIFIR